MIAVIIAGCFIGLCIILKIIKCILDYWYNDDTLNTPVFFMIIATGIMVSVAGISLVFGYRQNIEGLTKERENLILHLRYDEQLTIELLDDIANFNNSYNTGNNLWCRFVVEDRSQMPIDINDYLKRK